MMKAKLQAVPESDLATMMNDIGMINSVLHIPQDEHEDYYLASDKAKQDKTYLELESVLTPLHYLLSGMTETQVAKKYDWLSPLKVVRLEHSSRKHTEFFEIFTENLLTAVRSGSGDETLGPQNLSLLSLRGADPDQLKGVYGITHIDSHGSREELADYVYDLVLGKVRAGYKFKFSEHLPAPQSSIITPVRVTPMKRKAGDDMQAKGQPESKKIKAQGEKEEGEAEGQVQPAAQMMDESGTGQDLQAAEGQGSAEGGGEATVGAGGEAQGGEGGGEGEGEGEGEEVMAMPPFSKLKVKELKSELEARGLPATGRKDELVTRLGLALSGVPVPGQEAAIPQYDPLDLLVTGGLTLESEAFEYGSARGLSSLQVMEIDKALEDRAASNLKDRFDVKTMKDMGVGPDALYDSDQEEVMRKIELGLDALKDFVHGVAQNGYGLVIY